MKSNQTMMYAIGVLIVASILMVVLLKKDPDKSAEPGSVTAQSSVANSTSSGVKASADETSQAASTRARKRPTSATADLEAEYGKARVALSRQVSSNVIGIMEDAVQMGEIMNTTQGAGFGGGLGGALGRLNGELQLTKEQRSKANSIYREYMQRKNEYSKAAVARMNNDPRSLMKLALASDSNARGEMTDAEYKMVQSEVSGDLTGIINPLDRKNFGGGSPLRDPQFVSDLRNLLDSEQAGKLDAAMAQRQSDASSDPNMPPGVEEGNIAGLQKMELEQLDKSIESARKVTTGIKSMMEGMGGLRDMMPSMLQGGQ
jgi:hypothetical protein